MTKHTISDLVLDLSSRKLNRRRLIQGAAAAGAGASALGFGGIGRMYYANAQDAAAGLMTISQEQQQTWVRNFNPFLPESASSRWPTQAGIYEPMMVYNTMKAELTPWLATKFEWNSDNTQLTFTLQDGVKWSDGQDFTAADVAYTYKLLQTVPGLTSPSSATAAFGDSGYLKSVEASADNKSVVFSFSRVYTPALYDLSQQPIVPEHIWKDVKDPVTFTNENPVGTGPFTNITKFEAQNWQLEKNDNYWQAGKPMIQGFKFPSYPGNDQANLATINGENDWAGNFIPDIDNTYVKKDPDHNHYWFPATGATVHLYANTTVKPFDDVNVRKAISMAIDREQAIKIAVYDYTHPGDATGLSDAAAAWKDQSVVDAGTWVKRDVDAANKLLDDAGYTKNGGTRQTKDGTPFKFELNVVTGWSDWVSVCQIMAQNLKEIGFDVSVKSYEVSAWQDKVQKGDFTLSIGWSSQGATPFNFYRGVMSKETFHPIGETSTENWQRFSSQEAEDLLAKFAQTSDLTEQKSIVAQLQKIYSDNAPGIPLYPGPQWGEYNSKRFTGFPDKDNPYALLSTYAFPDRLLVFTTVKPVAASA
jgi:peptide/nickel transport system substrate-binding protein